ncbi:MAG: hypothetical protein IPG83_02215 [Novosphingobium sp.]|nr:hypothetical protein [Novosphingobium sp.]
MTEPFALQTADARFDPREPVRVNGFLYVPADARQPPKVAQPNYAALGLGSAEEAEGRN